MKTPCEIYSFWNDFFCRWGLGKARRILKASEHVRTSRLWLGAYTCSDKRNREMTQLFLIYRNPMAFFGTKKKLPNDQNESRAWRIFIIIINWLNVILEHRLKDANSVQTDFISFESLFFIGEKRSSLAPAFTSQIFSRSWNLSSFKVFKC